MKGGPNGKFSVHYNLAALVQYRNHGKGQHGERIHHARETPLWEHMGGDWSSWRGGFTSAPTHVIVQQVEVVWLYHLGGMYRGK